jgi:hypothetical protein
MKTLYKTLIMVVLLLATTQADTEFRLIAAHSPWLYGSNNFHHLDATSTIGLRFKPNKSYSIDFGFGAIYGKSVNNNRDTTYVWDNRPESTFDFSTSITINKNVYNTEGYSLLFGIGYSVSFNKRYAGNSYSFRDIDKFDEDFSYTQIAHSIKLLISPSYSFNKYISVFMRAGIFGAYLPENKIIIKKSENNYELTGYDNAAFLFGFDALNLGLDIYLPL